MSLADAMDRTAVLEPSLKVQVGKEMTHMTPLPSIYYPDFIALNQEDRADNIRLVSRACSAHVETLRMDMREFKRANRLDKVIILWTANTEGYAQLLPGINDTADNLLKAIESAHEEIKSALQQSLLSPVS